MQPQCNTMQKRPPCWTPEEDQILLRIIPLHRHLRRTNGFKRTHFVNWKDVFVQWNAEGAQPRPNCEALRNRYNNLMKHSWDASELGSSPEQPGGGNPSNAITSYEHQGAPWEGTLLEEGRVEEMQVAADEAAADEATVDVPALPRQSMSQLSTAEEHCGSSTVAAARHVGAGTDGHAAPSFAFVDAKNPDHAVYIFNSSYYGGMPDHIEDILVRETWQLDEEAFGGCPDQRSIDGSALKGEGGSKSLCRGYAVQDGTRWMVAEHVGLPSQRVLSFDELFDCKLMVSLWRTGKEGRPPVPEPRVGHGVFDKVQELHDAFEKLAWIAWRAKRDTNMAAALEAETLTEPTRVQISGGAAGMQTLEIDVRLFGVPGITGVTWNAHPVVDGNPRKVEKDGSYSAESTDSSSYRIVNTFPPASRGSGAGHNDDADTMEQRVKHLGIKHSAASVLFLYARDPYELMVGGEFNMVLRAGPKGVWKKKTMPKTGSTLAVSAKKALLVVNHASKSYHMASTPAAKRDATEGERDVIETMQPGTRTRTASSVDAPKVLVVRGSVVMHTSEVPTVSSHLAWLKEQTGSLAAALTAKQKRWRVEYGIGPINQNEKLRISLAPLRARVKDFPVNGPQEGITDESMAPFFALAWEHRKAFYALGADGRKCDGAEELDDDWESGTDSEGEESAEPEEAEAPLAPRVRKAAEKYGY